MLDGKKKEKQNNQIYLLETTQKLKLKPIFSKNKPLFYFNKGKGTH